MSCRPKKPEFTYRKCPNEKKADILAFIRKHKRAPHAGESDTYHHYMSKASLSFDPIFRQTVLETGYAREFDPEAAKASVFAFIYERQHFPRLSACQDPGERLIAARMRRFTDEVYYQTSYDKRFAAELEALREYYPKRP